MRTAEINRATKETKISLRLDLDGSGEGMIDTGCGFMDHMLTLFAAHGGFSLGVDCKGDTNVDYHHSVEDIGICLGLAFAQALGDKKGIRRYGDIVLPMDEALVLCAVDISGRDCLNYDVDGLSEKVGDLDTELVKEFLLGFVRNFPISLHIVKLAGENTHHIIEAVFKALGRTLGNAVSIDEKNSDKIPSTKGVL